MNAYLQRQEIAKKIYAEKNVRVEKQMMLDTLEIALNQEFGFGYDRIKRLVDAWTELYDHYHLALEGEMESDVTQEHLDRALKAIVGDRQEFYTFAERYQDIKQCKYDKPFKSAKEKDRLKY